VKKNLKSLLYGSWGVLSLHLWTWVCTWVWHYQHSVVPRLVRRQDRRCTICSDGAPTPAYTRPSFDFQMNWRLQSEHYHTSAAPWIHSRHQHPTVTSYLAHFFAELVNHSISIACIAEVLKEAYITPRLKTLILTHLTSDHIKLFPTYQCYKNCWRSSWHNSFCPISTQLYSKHFGPIILLRRQFWRCQTFYLTYIQATCLGSVRFIRCLWQGWSRDLPVLTQHFVLGQWNSYIGSSLIFPTDVNMFA